MFLNISHINWYIAKVRNMQKIIADVKAHLFGLRGDLQVDGIQKSIIEWQKKKQKWQCERGKFVVLLGRHKAVCDVGTENK